jgi:DNA-binding NarL/FixJ family response regulator
MKKIKIGLIDDDPSLSQKTKEFLDFHKDFSVELYCPDLPSFFMKYDMQNPLDVLLLDISLSGNVDSFQHLSKIRNILGAQTKVLIYSGHTEEEYIQKALVDSVSGYFLKGSDFEDLITAIYLVHEGKKYISSLLSSQLYSIINDMTTSQETQENLRIRTSTLENMGLNKREIQVAIRIIEGYSYEEIAQEIFLSINTVRHYIKSLYAKLGVNSKINLANQLRPFLEKDEIEKYLRKI